MDRRTGPAGRAALAGLLLSLVSYASEEPPKTTLDIVNRCAVPVWVRSDDNPAAGTDTFDDQWATPIATGASYRVDIADDDHDGAAIAVSATQADVGAIIPVDPEHLEVVLEGDRCRAWGG